MNIREKDIVSTICKYKAKTQRAIAELTGHSLGVVNKSIKKLIEQEYLDENMNITTKTETMINSLKTKRAIILAAGYGMRMVPINTETTKGLLEVNGEPLIERFIKQLQSVGIYEIYIVVGFMKEHYDYLIDKYNVKLIVNLEYQTKNNLHSLKLVKDYLENSYIIPCDIWCEQNPFSEYELYSWYMVDNTLGIESQVRVNRKLELVKVDEEENGNSMIGICFLQKKEAEIVKSKIEKFTQNHRYDHAFWEETLFENNVMITVAKMVINSKVIEINTYEQLRDLDSNSNQLKSEVIETISNALNVTPDKVTNITVLKKGMTNRSFLFTCEQKKYIMRIPGEGTEQLIDRKQEASVYMAILPYKISDDIAYIDPENGYKITEFLDDTRCCNPKEKSDVELCMKKLKYFHSLDLKVDHEFDIFGLISFYEDLWNGNQCAYKDYEQTKENVISLEAYIKKHANQKSLTHIDAIPDNFLIMPNNEVRLIDWEYAGMQDPHVDIAMFAIYSFYDKDEIDQLIDIYFEGSCSKEIRTKIYCYVSVCGLLWSNWCEYKRNLGIEFGEYSLKQYRYAKDFYKIAMREIEKETEYE